jgi:tripartite-type tricarboxylate transporter receptor subunit TctC
MKLCCRALSALVTLVLFFDGARAEYPDRTIRLIVPFSAGGANDSVARLVANKLGPILGQPVIVDNRPGGGTVRGTALVASADPDGYTLLLISPAHTINPYINKTLPYKTLSAFTPISQITRSSYILVTAPESKFKSVADFRRFAKENKGQINFGSSGVGSAPYLAGQLFASRIGLTAVHVPYQGGGPALVAIIRGDIDMYFSSVAGARPMIESNKVDALAVSGDRRLKAFPDLPTVAESGVDGFAINGWYGIVGPANMPAEVTTKLNKAIDEATKDPGLIAALEQEGEEVAASTPDQFGALVREDLERYHGIVVSSGIEPH